MISRIFDHCLERGYLTKGQVVGDPFGGIGTGGITAAYCGLHWVGVELEKKFCSLGRRNFALHTARWKALGAPRPLLLQGDSRQFHLLVHGIVSSPPYADSVNSSSKGGIDWGKAGHHDRVDREVAGVQGTTPQNYGEVEGQIGRLRSGEVSGVISSPPFTQTSGGAKGINVNGYNGRPDIKPDFLGKRTYQGQGGDRESGNIETLKAGEVAAVIGSPPYAEISTGAGGLNTKPAKHAGQQSGRSAKAASQDTDQLYGQTEGQISRLKDGSVEAVVTSPPFRDSRSDTTKSKPTRHGGPCADRHVIRTEWFRTFTWIERFKILCGFNLLVYIRIPTRHNAAAFQPIVGARTTKHNTPDNHLIELLERACQDVGAAEISTAAQSEGQSGSAVTD